MHDLHLELVLLLQEQATSTNQYAIREKIKIVADSLQNLVSSSYIDAAFAYYIAGYYVRATRLISQVTTDDDIHPIQRWLTLIFAKQFVTIENRIHILMEDIKYSDSQIAEDVANHGLSDVEAVDRILTRRIADALNIFVEFARCGDEAKMITVYSILTLCKLLACKANESRCWWWIECLRLVITEYSTYCLWTQLKSMRLEG